jgi:hypothetical protein
MIAGDSYQRLEVELIATGDGLDEFAAEGTFRADPRRAVGPDDQILRFASEGGEVSPLPVVKKIAVVEREPLPQSVPHAIAKTPRLGPARRRQAFRRARGAAIAAGVEIRHRVHHKGAACVALANKTAATIGACIHNAVAMGRVRVGQASLRARRTATAASVEIRHRVQHIQHKAAACVALAGDSAVAFETRARPVLVATRARVHGALHASAAAAVAVRKALPALNGRALPQAPAAAGLVLLVGMLSGVLLAVVSSGGFFVGVPHLASEPSPMSTRAVTIDARPALSVTAASALPAPPTPAAASRLPVRPAVALPTPAPPRDATRRPVQLLPAPHTATIQPAATRAAVSEAPAPAAVGAPEPARAASTPAPIDLSAAHRSAVGEVLASYRQSYNNLDATSVATIWRGADLKALRRAFAGLSSQRLTFDRCEVSVTTVDRANAKCEGQLNYVPRFGDTVPQQRRVEWTMNFAKSADSWVIVGVSAR